MRKEFKWLRKVCGNKRVYAIPKNGLIIAALARLNVVKTPEEADIIFDDMVDTGKTLKEYIGKKKVVVLYVKDRSPFKDQVTFMERRSNKWIRFWWESPDEVPKMKYRR